MSGRIIEREIKKGMNESKEKGIKNKESEMAK